MVPVLAPGPGPGVAAVQAGGDLASLSAQPGGGLLHPSTGEDGAHHRSHGVLWSYYMRSYGHIRSHSHGYMIQVGASLVRRRPGPGC